LAKFRRGVSETGSGHAEEKAFSRQTHLERSLASVGNVQFEISRHVRDTLAVLLAASLKVERVHSERDCLRAFAAVENSFRSFIYETHRRSLAKTLSWEVLLTF
jgi:hypothetical protein